MTQQPIPVFPHAVLTRDARNVYTLEIHGEKSLNVLSTPVMTGVRQAASWVGSQPDARAVVLCSSGDKAFIAGANIHEMAALTPDSARAFIGHVRDLCEAVRAIPVPTVVRIHGFCLGAGMELAAACDVRLGSTRASFGMPEVRVGIPSVVHAALLPPLIGAGATNWLLLTGEHIDAPQALAWGFLQFAVAPEELDALVERTIAAIVATGPHAIRAQKALLRHWERDTLDHAIARSVDRFGDAFMTDEPARLMAPFLKRFAVRGERTDSPPTE